jgi:hypothetical protein
MTGWQVFEGAVEPLVWGRATYTILRLPDGVASALLAAGATRVEGEIAEHPVNLAMSRAPEVEGVFLWAGQSLLDRTGITPGERVEVRLRPAPADAVDTPEDLAAALRRADRTVEWEALTPGKRRSYIYQIGTAKTAATREKRIAALIEGLAP